MSLKKTEIRYRGVILAFGALCLTLIGFIYTWSIFVDPLQAEFGWTRAQIINAYTISLSVLFVGMALDSVLCTLHLNRFSAVLGPMLLLIGAAVSSRVGTFGESGGTSLVILYVFYGLFMGLGTGIVFNTWLVAVIAWFPDHLGLASGAMQIGFGLGGTIFAPIATWMIYTPSMGWRAAILMFGGISGVVSLVAVLFYSPAPPEEWSRLQAKEKDFVPYSLRPGEMFREGCYWVNTIWSLLMRGAASALIGHALQVATGAGASLMVATMAVSLMNFGNGAGRVFGGALVDRVGYYRAQQSLSWLLLLIAVLFLFSYTRMVAILVAILFIVLNMGYAASISIGNTFTRSMFGMKYYKINSVLGMFIVAGNTYIWSGAINQIYNKTGIYTGYFYMMIAMALGSIALSILTEKLSHRTKVKYDAIYAAAPGPDTQAEEAT